jgi:hypothetical protein
MVPPPDDAVEAWNVVTRFVENHSICQCGTVETALRVVYETLAKYRDNASPGAGPAAVFAAYVLDSWRLLEHARSLDTGANRTVEGDELYAAMRFLDEAGLPLLPET